MKKIISCGVLLIAIFSNCKSNKTHKHVKSQTTTVYATKDSIGILVKDTIELSYVSGFDTSDKQFYFVGFSGYNKHDTSYYKGEDSFYSKKDGDITFTYRGRNLSDIFVRKGDTTFQYKDSIEKPVAFTVFDKYKRILQYVDISMSKTEIYNERNFDEFGNLTFAIINEKYYPSDLDKLIFSEAEILRKKSKNRTIIKEIKYTYY